MSAILFAVPAILSSISVGEHGILQGVIATFFVYYAALTLSIVIYRISPLHPLARYPGPMPAKVTRWYWALISLQGRNHLRLKELHERYGEVVRIGE